VTVVLTAVAIAAPYRHAMRRSRPPLEVVAAWIVTGPLGHLYAGIVDWLGVLVRYVRARGHWERM
jgi:hypothetical protein